MQRHRVKTWTISTLLCVFASGCSTIKVNYEDLAGKGPTEHQVTYEGFRQSRSELRRTLQRDKGGMGGLDDYIYENCCFYVCLPVLLPIALLNVPLSLAADTILLPYTLSRDHYLRKKFEDQQMDYQVNHDTLEYKLKHHEPTAPPEVLTNFECRLLLDFRKSGESYSTTHAPFASRSFELSLHQKGKLLIGPIASTNSALSGSARGIVQRMYWFYGTIRFPHDKGKWIVFNFTFAREDGGGSGTAQYECEDGAVVSYGISVKQTKTNSLY